MASKEEKLLNKTTSSSEVCISLTADDVFLINYL